MAPGLHFACHSSAHCTAIFVWLWQSTFCCDCSAGHNQSRAPICQKYTWWISWEQNIATIRTYYITWITTKTIWLFEIFNCTNHRHFGLKALVLEAESANRQRCSPFCGLLIHRWYHRCCRREAPSRTLRIFSNVPFTFCAKCWPNHHRTQHLSCTEKQPRWWKSVRGSVCS